MANELVFIVVQDNAHSEKLTQWLQEARFHIQTFQDTELCLNTLDLNPSAIVWILIFLELQGFRDWNF